MLSERLRELEEEGLVARTVVPSTERHARTGSALCKGWLTLTEGKQQPCGLPRVLA